ncbi:MULTISPECIES: MBL fold metallo-hydrolase [Rhodomicrobium]|uniref:MBL fold metallo-hydrolase n=1 Tax=Rhodomicrobium TaxID=1068 RepID=UPI000B4B0DD8|nr:MULTISPECIES: MBL fold metallo-hydrolase [Rhodomicrobium]
MSLHFTILGCGSSPGVPRIDGHWGVCDPANAKNRRRRCAMLVERFADDKRTAVLIDTGPDLREQILTAGLEWLDGVLYTHDHADHTHGIDDLRILSYRGKRRIDVYFDPLTGAILQRRFDYCFSTPQGSAYPPIVKAHTIHAGEPMSVTGPGGEIAALPFRQHHGEIDSLGFRFGNLAYSSDVHDLPEETLPLLEGLDVWIIDALRYTRHPSHFSVEEALEWIARVRPKRAILTHMHIDLDYDTLRKELPEGVEPAYDGMRIELAE